MIWRSRNAPDAATVVADIDRLENGALRALAAIDAGLHAYANLPNRPEHGMFRDVLLDARGALAHGLATEVGT